MSFLFSRAETTFLSWGWGGAQWNSEGRNFSCLALGSPVQSPGQIGLSLLSSSLCPVMSISQKADHLLRGRPWFFSCYYPREQGSLFGSCSLGGLCFLTSQQNHFLLLDMRHVPLPEALLWLRVSLLLRMGTGDAVWRTSPAAAPHLPQGSKPATGAWCLRALRSPERIHRRTTQKRCSQPR